MTDQERIEALVASLLDTLATEGETLGANAIALLCASGAVVVKLSLFIADGDIAKARFMLTDVTNDLYAQAEKWPVAARAGDSLQ